MNDTTNTGVLAREVRRLIGDFDVRSLDLLEDWDGQTLSDLEHVLTDEEYEMLLDNLRPTRG